MFSQSPPPYGTLINQIYQQGYAALVWLDSVISPASASGNPASLSTQANLVLNTLLNGVEIINGLNIQAGVNNDYPLLQQAAAIPITYTSGMAQTIDNRITGLANLQVTLQSTLPTFISGAASGYLNLGQVAIPDINLVSILGAWTGEPTPGGYTAGNLTPYASGNQQNWVALVSGYAAYMGNSPTTVLDGVVRAAQGSLAASTILQSLSIQDATTSQLSPLLVWNTAYALPATLAATRLISPSPALASDQNSMAARSFLITMAEQVAGFSILAKGLASSAGGSSGLAIITQQGQGLMDVAAQNLGNFERWNQLAGTVPAPWGAGALNPGTYITLASGSPALTQAQILGTDLNFGAQNQPIPTWTGDFQTNTGISNFRASLGRRLATTLGSLIYHQTYGSRIPPEIGEILTIGGSALITAYGQAAISADPRTQSILSATTTTINGAPNAVQFNATVQPIGPGLQPIGLNEVLSP